MSDFTSPRMTWQEEQDKIDAEIATFPKVFALVGWPNQRFTISRADSFVSEGRVQLYVHICSQTNDDCTEAFAREEAGLLRPLIRRLV